MITGLDQHCCSGFGFCKQSGLNRWRVEGRIRLGLQIGLDMVKTGRIRMNRDKVGRVFDLTYSMRRTEIKEKMSQNLVVDEVVLRRGRSREKGSGNALLARLM